MKTKRTTVTCYCANDKCDFMVTVEHPGMGPSVCPQCRGTNFGCTIFSEMDPGPRYQPRPQIIISSQDFE